jgi:hypothetical protein
MNDSKQTCTIQLSVSSVRNQPAAAVDHSALSKVKLNGHG